MSFLIEELRFLEQAGSFVSQGAIAMRFISSRAAIPIAVSLVTVIVCFFGIRAELRAANYSVFDHFFRSSPGGKAAPAFAAGDQKRDSDSVPR
jgi:hypothetical protein